MKFSQIPGQENIIKKLLKSVQESRVSHAQIFTGPSGCGNMALALAFAQYVSCEDKSENDSCGKCKSCVKYDRLIHPDLHFVFPVVKGKKATDPVSDSYIEEWRSFISKSTFPVLQKWLDVIEVGNAQGMIFASEASEIIKKLSLKTFESEFKIMIIWLPEKMHQATANKLLKMIEEPPDKTLFLLVSDEPDKIISTIHSRCQVVKIQRFEDEDIHKFLVQNYNIDENKAWDLTQVSNGNIIRGIELCEQEESSLINLDRFKNLMRFAWKRDIRSLLEWTENIASTGRENQKSFIIFSLRILRENFMLTLGQRENKLVFMTNAESLFAKNFHSFITNANIYPLTDELNLAHSHIEANGNAKIVFLDLALKITKLIR